MDQSDRRSRLISYIHSSRETRQHCRMGLCEDSDFAVEDSKSSSGSVLCQKLLSRTAPQSLRSFLWMLDFAWLGHLLSVFGTWWLNFCSQTKTQHVTRKQKVDQWSEVDHVPTTHWLWLSGVAWFGRGTAQNFALFSLSHPIFVFFLSLGSYRWVFWWCFWRPGPSSETPADTYPCPKSPMPQPNRAQVGQE